MEQKIVALKDRVTAAAANPEFIHHQWFTRWHLEIVEQIATEVLEHYPHADRDLVLAMAWLHDYGKILNFDNQYQETLTAAPKLLSELGFASDFMAKITSYIETLDRKMEVELRESPLEVQIISSADAASHFVGPFYQMWWYEHADKPYQELMADNLTKAAKDWDHKMVLPEVRKAFETRVKHTREQAGILPKRYLA